MSVTFGRTTVKKKFYLSAIRLQHNHWSDYEHATSWSTSDLFIHEKKGYSPMVITICEIK
jgi:hypothetical protein